MTYNEYIENNYDELVQIARVLFNNTKLDPAEVVSELYLDVIENKRVINPNKKDYEYYSIRWLKNATRWQGGNPTKKLKVTGKINQNYRDQQNKIYNTQPLKGTELNKDLQRVGFSEDQADQLEKVILFSKRLPLYHKRLFELYYIDGMSLQKIGDSCSLPKVSIHRDVKKVVKEIKNEFNI